MKSKVWQDLGNFTKKSIQYPCFKPSTEPLPIALDFNTINAKFVELIRTRGAYCIEFEVSDLKKENVYKAKIYQKEPRGLFYLAIYM